MAKETLSEIFTKNRKIFTKILNEDEDTMPSSEGTEIVKEEPEVAVPHQEKISEIENAFRQTIKDKLSTLEGELLKLKSEASAKLKSEIPGSTPKFGGIVKQEMSNFLNNVFKK